MNNLNDIFFTPSANQELTYEQILEDLQKPKACSLRYCQAAHPPLAAAA